MNSNLLKVVSDKIGQILPGPDVKGEPFWTIMEIKNGENTGTFFATDANGKKVVLLFPTKEHAEETCKKINTHSPEFQVRGISKNHLKVLLALEEKKFGQLQLGISLPTNGPENQVFLVDANGVRKTARKMFSIIV